MELEVEAKRVKEHVMVMSRVNDTKWQYVDPEKLSKRMLSGCKMENGGREIAQFKKDKYNRKTFNYNEEELAAIKNIVHYR